MNDTALPAPLLDQLALAPLAVAPATRTPDGENDATASLPGDHPGWQRDVLAISSRVRMILAALRPVVVTVQSFWDHIARSAPLGSGRTIDVDPSGCYRLR